MTLSERKKNLHGKGSKIGQDKLKDKRTNHFHAKFNQLSHLQSRESTSYGSLGLLFVLHGNRTNCHQQQYESVADLNQLYSSFKSLGANM